MSFIISHRSVTDFQYTMSPTHGVKAQSPEELYQKQTHKNKLNGNNFSQSQINIVMQLGLLLNKSLLLD